MGELSELGFYLGMLGLDVGGELVFIGDGGCLDLGVLGEDGFEFGGLDADAVVFDLMVDAAEEDELPF